MTESMSLRRTFVGACDCHMHVYDARFPHIANAIYRPRDALVPDYLAVRARLGLERTVVVTPSAYGTDNRCTLDAVEQLGPSARAVAVVDASIKASDLLALDKGGVRGVRFNLVQAGANTSQMLVPIAARIADLDWHVQVHALLDQLVELEPILTRLATPVVLDHLARVPPQVAAQEKGLDVLSRMLSTGRTWVKLSAPYLESREGRPAYGDCGPLVRTLVRAAPERLVWGSDWPHPSEQANLPDDLDLLQSLSGWIPDSTVRHRILVSNPARLYGF